MGLLLIRFKSSHPDQFFQFQINPLQRPLHGHCFFVGSNCGSFVGNSPNSCSHGGNIGSNPVASTKQNKGLAHSGANPYLTKQLYLAFGKRRRVMLKPLCQVFLRELVGGNRIDDDNRFRLIRDQVLPIKH